MRRSPTPEFDLEPEDMELLGRSRVSPQPELDLEPEDMEQLSRRTRSRTSTHSSSARSSGASGAAVSPQPPALNSRVTSNDHVALQFFWQGYEVFVHSRAKDSVASCFFKTQCGCTPETGGDAEFLRIIPVHEVRERSIHDMMKVQIVSVSTQRYLRATRMSKFLKWSDTRDEQTVFQIQILDRSKPLTRETKFTLASSVWPDHAVGFTQTPPLGFSRDLHKAVGFLTMEKKKHQAPLIFPIRFRAVHRAVRFIRYNQSPSFEEPVPFVTSNELVFIDEDNEEAVADVPIAILLTTNTAPQPEDEFREICPYCSVLFRRNDALLAHIRDNHGDWMHRESVAGSFCTHCGHRCLEVGVCGRCPNTRVHT
jgi:hypothetical protein